MTIDETINNWALDFRDKLSDAILARDFEKVSEDEYTINIMVLGEIVCIWNVENQDVFIHGIEYNNMRLHLRTGIYLKSPNLCRKILRENTKKKR